MIITEFRELEAAAKVTPHIRRVLYAALDIAVYTDADFDIVIAACILHEYPEPAKLLLKREWDKEKVEKVQQCVDVIAGENVADTIEAKVVCDAHHCEDCGIIGESRELLTSGNVEKYLEQPFNSEIYNGFYTKRAKTLAKQRRYAAESFYNSLKSEINDVNKKGSAMLKEMLEAEPMYNKLLLIPTNCGFKMDDYYVWGSSVIFASGKYHMFASRWRKNLKFPEGAMIGSEIVHAVSDTPEGPFEYKNTVINSRHRGWWDSQMADSPQVVKIRDTYVLFYGGAGLNDYKTRRIGYAFTKNINGKWERQNKCIDLGSESCGSPSVSVGRDGGILLAFCRGNHGIAIARADQYNGEYKILNENIMPDIMLESSYLFKSGSHYELIVRDIGGALTGHEGFGAILESVDGIDWRVKKHCLAYDHTLMYNDLTIIKAERRERPQLLLNNSGKPTHLYTGVFYKGEAMNVCQPVNPN